MRGRPVAEILDALRAGGLDLFFSSRLVPPWLRVVDEPRERAPRALAAEILAPHGLQLVDGPGGRLVVARVETPPSLCGVVRDRSTGAPVASVQVLLEDVHRATTDADGRFAIESVDTALGAADGPGSARLEARHPGFVVGRRTVELAPHGVTEVELVLEPTPLALDEIVVVPSRVTLLGESSVAGLALDNDQIESLPHLGDDIFRALTLMPGVTGEETSARFSVRGGRTDEVLVLLDRVELFEPYHLKDYSSSLSIVAPRALREVSLLTGGFPVRYGDRMSGVLEMTTVSPPTGRTSLGLGTLSAEVGRSGRFADGRGTWLSQARRGSLDLTLEFLGKTEKPSYWDAFGKVEWLAGPGRAVGLHALHSDDQLDFFNVDPDTLEDYRTAYSNSYVWLTHQETLGRDLVVDTTVSIGRVDRDRRGFETEPSVAGEHEGDGEPEGSEGDDGAESEDDDAEVETFGLVDRRGFDAVGVKQDWVARAGRDASFHFGFEARRLVARYDYRNERSLDDPLEAIRSEPRRGVTRLQTRLPGEQQVGYLSARLRPRDELTLELGLRFDEHTLTRDRNLSPRLNAAYARGATTLRASWGHFHQGQRPYELQVEDGVTRLGPTERTEQRVLGIEHRAAARWGLRDPFVRLEGYQRRISDPRPRYENLFEPISIFPEIEPDRVLLAPDRARASGVELFVGARRGDASGWLSYAWARVEDRIDARWVPRRIDQRHTVTADLDLRLGAGWRLNLAWRWHSGWPTTAVGAAFEPGEQGEPPEPALVFGPINAERLRVYHRLDLRASRERIWRGGTLGFYVEIQNVYDRENQAGFDVDFEIEERPDGRLAVTPLEEPWGGIVPSFGLTWER